MPPIGSQPARSAAPARAPTPRAALLGTITILVVLALRVLVAYDPTPGWGGDPLEMESPIVSLTPMGSLILDIVAFAGSALILASMSRSAKAAPPVWQTLCLALGAAAIALHARVLRDASMENVILGSNWLASFTTAFAATQAARDQRLRALIAAMLLGLIAPLAIKGAVQYFIEHPESVKMFQENKDRILSAQGWTADSPMARAYWERLRQAEATGWFGLANVFATLAAASFTALTGFTIAVFRDRAASARPQTLAFLILGLIVSAAGIVLAGAKGGYAAAVLGLALVVLVYLWPRLVARVALLAPAGQASHARRLGGILAIFLPALALLAVAARGLIGERLHELSLLFRWFYIQTAAKIFVQHPLLGTGPGGFKEAYMLLKPAISPEDVSSPHSILFDLSARLGVGGLALVALLIAWLGRAGCELLPAPAELPSCSIPSDTTRTDARLLLITISIATAAAALIEQPTATVTSTLVRAGGLAGFMLIAIAALRLFRSDTGARFAPSALAAAAIAAFTHCQVELTGVTPGANMWVFLLMAIAVVPGAATAPAATLRWRRLGVLVLFLALALVAPMTNLYWVARWDLLLRRANERVEDIPSLTARAEAIAQRKPLPHDSAKALATDLSAATGMRIDESQIAPALMLLRYQRANDALAILRQANAISPPDSEAHHAAARLLLQLAAMDQSRGHTSDASASAAAAEKLAEDFNELTGPSPSQLAWLGIIRRSRYELDHDTGHLGAAAQSWEKAAALAPHEPLYAAQLARTYAQLNRPEDAAKWAGIALNINTDLHLDPLRQFTPAEVEELRALAGYRRRPSPAAPPPP